MLVFMVLGSYDQPYTNIILHNRKSGMMEDGREHVMCVGMKGLFNLGMLGEHSEPYHHWIRVG